MKENVDEILRKSELRALNDGLIGVRNKLDDLLARVERIEDRLGIAGDDNATR